LQSSSQTILKPESPELIILEKHSFAFSVGSAGLLIGSLIITLWGANLAYLMTVDIGSIPFYLILPGILSQTFLDTGLFITAHDAMHGVLYTKNPKINHFLGGVAVMAYAFLPYQTLLKKHWLHHHFPASDRDPDFHDGVHKSPFAWFFYFMRRYFGWRQFNSFTVAYPVAHWVLHIPHINLFLFWLFPLVLSTLQLFYFGTYLTHRQPHTGYSNSHRAETTNFSPFWSFLTCYHFGYHREHHEYPNVPWWQLPNVYQDQQTHHFLVKG
jgi:beta-carotene/zeaxanthin 4-ketolase